MKKSIYIEQSNKSSRMFFAIVMLLYAVFGLIDNFLRTNEWGIEEYLFKNYILYGLIVIISLVLIVLFASLNKSLMVLSAIGFQIPVILISLLRLFRQYFDIWYILFIIMPLVSIIFIALFSKTKQGVFKVLSIIFLSVNATITGFYDITGLSNGWIFFGGFISKISELLPAFLLIGSIWIMSVTYKKVNRATELDLQNEKPMPKQIQNLNESNITDSDVINAIKNYKELLDDGIITQAEFDSKKKDLLNM